MMGCWQSAGAMIPMLYSFPGQKGAAEIAGGFPCVIWLYQLAQDVGLRGERTGVPNDYLLQVQEDLDIA